MSLAVYPGASASSAIRGLAYTVIKQPRFNTLVQEAPNFYCTRIAQSNNPVWKWTLTYEVLLNKLGNIANGNAPWTDLQALIGFFLQQQGQFASFLFSDPDDHAVGPATLTTAWAKSTFYPLNAGILESGHWQKVTTAGIAGSSAPSWNHSGGTTSDGGVVWTDQGAGYTAIPNLYAQLPVVQDSGSGTYYSPLQRNLGGFLEDVTDLDTSVVTPAFYDNGVLQSGGGGGHYTLSTSPGLAISGKSYMGLYLTWNAPYVPTGPVTATFNFFFRVRFETDQIDFEKFVTDLWTVGGSEGRGGSGALTLVSERPPKI